MIVRKQLLPIDFGWVHLHSGQHRNLMSLAREHLTGKLPDHMAILLREWIRNET